MNLHDDRIKRGLYAFALLTIAAYLFGFGVYLASPEADAFYISRQLRIADPIEKPVGLAVVSGYKWNDINKNSVWDLGEEPINGWEICQTTKIRTKPEVTTCVITGSGNWTNGYYEFVHTKFTTVFLDESPQFGWIKSWPTREPHIVIIDEFKNYGDYNFGNYQDDNIIEKESLEEIKGL